MVMKTPPTESVHDCMFNTHYELLFLHRGTMGTTSDVSRYGHLTWGIIQPEWLYLYSCLHAGLGWVLDCNRQRQTTWLSHVLLPECLSYGIRVIPIGLCWIVKYDPSVVHDTESSNITSCSWLVYSRYCAFGCIIIFILATTRTLNDESLNDRKILAAFPIGLYYFIFAWLIIVV